MYKIEGKLAFINVQVPVSIGTISAELLYQLIIVEDGENPGKMIVDNLEPVDTINVIYNNVPVINYISFREFHREMGIDLDAEFEKLCKNILTEEELQKIADTVVFK